MIMSTPVRPRVRVLFCSLLATSAVIAASGQAARAQHPPQQPYAVAQSSGQSSGSGSKKATPPATQPAPAAAQPASLPVPPPEVLLMMVRGALTAIDQGNKTQNYSVLYALGGPLLRETTQEKMAESFANLRKEKINLEPVLVLNPQLVQAPTIDAKGLMLLAGLFPSQPLQVRFQLTYQPVDGAWRLAGMNLGLVPVNAAANANQPAAPAAAPAATPAAAPAAPPAAAPAPEATPPKSSKKDGASKK